GRDGGWRGVVRGGVRGLVVVGGGRAGQGLLRGGILGGFPGRHRREHRELDHDRADQRQRQGRGDHEATVNPLPLALAPPGGKGNPRGSSYAALFSSSDVMIYVPLRASRSKVTMRCLAASSRSFEKVEYP